MGKNAAQKRRAEVPANAVAIVGGRRERGCELCERKERPRRFVKAREDYEELYYVAMAARRNGESPHEGCDPEL